MSKIRSILLLILTLSKPALCDTVFGFVRDQTDNESLSYVNVFIPDTEYGTVTNDDGYYVISGIQLDTLTIKASIIGYVPVTQQIDFTSNTEVRLDFSMTPQVLEFPEITVTTERQRFENDIGLSTVHLSNSQIQEAPSLVEADVFRTLQLLPGVQGLSDFSSALYVRGGTPDQNMILLDGVTIYNPFHLGGLFSTFNTDAIKEVEFSAGGFSSKYGGRMGSILEITNKDGNAKSFSGKANISLISSKILLEGPLPRIGSMHGSYMVSGRRTYFDTIVNGVLFLSGKLHEPGIIGFPYYFYDY